MELTRGFDGLGKGDASIAGGKGASLGEMTNAGIPVPPGFVILASVFDRFLDETDLRAEVEARLSAVDTEKMHTVEDASAKIQFLIKNAVMPADIAEEVQTEFAKLDAPFVAVRSSATAEDSASAAWAGQLDSFLNTTAETLLTNVQNCWASLFTPRAIFYRFEKQLHTQRISVAVVVQKMIASEVSGIAFSVHPVTEDRNQLIIEAGYGLGEAIVSGQVTPDSYVVEKEPRKIIDINVASQTRALYRKEGGGNEWQDIAEPKASAQVLSEAQIFELSEIVIGIENHYGFPCDIEWAFENGEFFIVQSRPITTLSAPVAQTSDQTFFREFGLDRYENWNEQGRWIIPPFLSSIMSRHHMVSRYGKEFMPGVALRSYFVLDYYAFQLHEEKRAILSYAKECYENGTLKGVIEKIDRAGEEVIRKLEEELRKDEASRKANTTHILELYQNLSDFWLLESYLGDLCIDLAKNVGFITSEQELFGKVQPYLRDTWIEEEVHDVLAIAQQCIGLLGKESVSAEDIAGDKKISLMVEEYLAKYSWSKYSWFLGQPIGMEDAPLRINQEVRNIKEGNHISVHKEKGVSDNAIVNLSVVTSYWRAQCGRMVALMGERFGFVFETIAEANGIAKSDALLLTYLELKSLLESGAWAIPNLPEVLTRKDGYFMMGDNKGGHIVFGQIDPRYASLKALFVDRPVQAQGVLTGLAASPGKVKGMVRIIQLASEFDTFKEGEILVSVETSPIFVPLMRKASAILTGKGGITSHAAIVSRELKKPCIIAIKDIIKILKTGDSVEIDAEAGTVRILNKEQQTSRKLLHSFDWVLPLDLSDFELEFQQRDTQAPLMSDIWSRGLQEHFVKELQLDVPTPEYVFTGESKGYVSSSDRKAIIDAVLTAIQDHSVLKRLLHEMMARTTVMEDAMYAVDADFEKDPSLAALPELWGRFVDALATMIPWFWIPWYVTESDLLADRVRTLLEKHAESFKDLSDVDGALGIVMFPLKEAAFQEEQRSLCELVKIAQQGASFKSDPIFLSAAKKHLEKYSWMTTYFIVPNEPLNMEQLTLRVEEGLRTGFVEEHEIRARQTKTNSELREQILARCSDDALNQAVADAQELGYGLTASIERGFKACASLIPMFKTIADKIGVPYKEWNYLLVDEITLALKGGEAVSDKVRQERRMAYVSHLKDGTVHWLFGSAAEEEAKRIVKSVEGDLSGTTSFSGKPAYKGKVEGRVRVAITPKEASELIAGEILVTSMTSPDYVPAMKRSAAVVTNEGGMLSHAAIMSREFGKPCIVGTKIATRALTTGDLVEVDADQGMVRILEKAAPKEKYVRFLHVKDFPYLIADIFYATYRDLGAVVIGKKGVVDVFLPQAKINECLASGEELYGSDTAFLKLRSDFAEYKERLVNATKSIPIAPQAFLKLLPEFFSYYSKAEFFYLDAFVSKNREKESFPAFVQTFEEFKNGTRTFLNSVFFGEEGHLSQALMVISKATGVPVSELPRYSLEELVLLQEKGIRTDIHARVESYSFGNLNSLDPALLGAQPAQMELLYGTSASPGKVKGAAFVIAYNFQDFDSMLQRIASMPEGSILVAETTSPEYMPACKKALGIITNQGGSLSHAAIVSRELGIPCLVAVDLATERIKTGDLIELDATEGVVRLSR
jgi:phosphoenolpyruvate synthase/pyruvate phosphate dikinase